MTECRTERNPNRPIMVLKETIEDANLPNEELGLLIRLLWLEQKEVVPTLENYEKEFVMTQIHLESSYHFLIRRGYIL